MKKTLNKITIFVAALFIALQMFTVNVNAANFTVSSSAKTVSPGQNFTVSVNFNGEGLFKASVSNGTGSFNNWHNGGTLSIPVKAGNSGKVTITVTAVDATTVSEEFLSNVSKTITVDIIQPSKPTETPPPTVVKPPTETAEQKAAREKKEKEEKEAKEKELKENTPLITSIKVVSNSESKNGEELTAIETEYSKFDYSYKLPSMIDEVKLNVEKEEDVTVEFEELVTFADSTEKVVSLKATKGDVSQEIKLTLVPREKVTSNINNTYVYEDANVDKSLKALGFEESKLDSSDNNFKAYSLGNLHVQMIYDDNKEIQFIRFDDEGEVLNTGQLYANGKSSIFIYNEEDEELIAQTLNGVEYDVIDLPVSEYLTSIDNNIKLNQSIKGWKYNDGFLVYGIDENGEKDLYYVDSLGTIKAAIATFDETSSSTNALLFGVSGALIVVSGLFLGYFLTTKKKLQAYRERYKTDLNL